MHCKTRRHAQHNQQDPLSSFLLNKMHVTVLVKYNGRTQTLCYEIFYLV